jgi:hypothetical protein
MSVRMTLLGSGGTVRAEIELTRPAPPPRDSDPDARLAAHLAAYLTRPRPVRGRATCAVDRPPPAAGIII